MPFPTSPVFASSSSLPFLLNHSLLLKSKPPPLYSTTISLFFLWPCLSPVYVCPTSPVFASPSSLPFLQNHPLLLKSKPPPLQSATIYFLFFLSSCLSPVNDFPTSPVFAPFFLPFLPKHTLLFSSSRSLYGFPFLLTPFYSLPSLPFSSVLITFSS